MVLSESDEIVALIKLNYFGEALPKHARLDGVIPISSPLAPSGPAKKSNSSNLKRKDKRKASRMQGLTGYLQNMMSFGTGKHEHWYNYWAVHS